ncbi:MAG TPA: TetR/AcrR family transcriptional regulator [Gemmatimonadales bacterium]|jgi:AcrR family transcriptional regulator
MRPGSNSVERLVDEACRAIGEVGLSGLTIGLIAERAGVSTALVHYHFDTKGRLLVASAERVADRRALRRGSALSSGTGLGALDELWLALVNGVDDGEERAWLELVLYAREEPGVAAVLTAPRSAARDAIVRRLPSLLRELGAPASAGSEEVAAALDAQLDGLVIALLGGQDPAVVRTAYDAFWLTLLAAAPVRPR